MKKIIIKREKPQLLKEAFNKSLYYIVFLVIFLALIIVQSIKLKDPFRTSEGLLESYEITEDKGFKSYSIKLKDDNVKYLIDDKKGLIKAEELVVDSKIVLQFVPSSTDNVQVFELKINDNLSLSILNDYKNPILWGIIVLSIFSALMIALIILRFINTLKKPLEEEIDYVELMLTTNKIISNSMFDSTYSIHRTLRIFSVLRTILVFMCFVLLAVALITLTSNNFSPILIGIYMLILILLVLCIPLIHPHFYSKDANIYAEEYKKYLNEGSTAAYYPTPFSFLKEGLRYDKDNNTSYYDYHELKLYITALYAKGDYAVNLFICSNLVNDTDQMDERNEFIIPLTYKNYQEILSNGIEILGLNNLLDNLEDEIKNNNKFKHKKYNVVKYNN